MRMTQLDREQAILVCADGGKTMLAEPLDIVALLDFMEPDWDDFGVEPESDGDGDSK